MTGLNMATVCRIMSSRRTMSPLSLIILGLRVSVSTELTMRESVTRGACPDNTSAILRFVFFKHSLRTWSDAPPVPSSEAHADPPVDAIGGIPIFAAVVETEGPVPACPGERDGAPVTVGLAFLPGGGSPAREWFGVVAAPAEVRAADSAVVAIACAVVLRSVSAGLAVLIARVAAGVVVHSTVSATVVLLALPRWRRRPRRAPEALDDSTCDLNLAGLL